MNESLVEQPRGGSHKLKRKSRKMQTKVDLKAKSAWLSLICYWKLMTRAKYHEKALEKKWTRLCSRLVFL